MNTIEPLENKIYKLSTGEKVNPDEIENLVEKTCHYVKYVVVDHDENKNNVAKATLLCRRLTAKLVIIFIL